MNETETPTPSEEQLRDAVAHQGDGEVAQLRKEKEELYNRLQRVSAELDNYQKRVARDRAGWTADAQRSLLEGLLPVLDNIDYALAAFDRGSTDPQTLKQGMTMVKEELLRQLAAQGIKPIPAEPGTPFDPERHQAVSMQETPGIDKEQVAMAVRRGYLHGERLLRPAQVVVSKPASS